MSQIDLTERHGDGSSIPWPGPLPVTAETWDTWLRWARAWSWDRSAYLAESSWRCRGAAVARALRAELGLPTEQASTQDLADTYEATVARLRGATC